MEPRTLPIITAACVLSAVLAAGVLAPAAYADHTDVYIIIPPGAGVPGCETTDACFIPTSANVTTQTQIIYVNNDNVTHVLRNGVPGNVDATALFDLVLAPGATAIASNTAPGETPYYCTVHPWMTGTVTTTYVDPFDFDVLATVRHWIDQSLAEYRASIDRLTEQNVELQRENDDLRLMVNSTRLLELENRTVYLENQTTYLENRTVYLKNRNAQLQLENDGLRPLVNGTRIMELEEELERQRADHNNFTDWVTGELGRLNAYLASNATRIQELEDENNLLRLQLDNDTGLIMVPDTRTRINTTEPIFPGESFFRSVDALSLEVYPKQYIYGIGDTINVTAMLDLERFERENPKRYDLYGNAVPLSGNLTAVTRSVQGGNASQANCYFIYNYTEFNITSQRGGLFGPNSDPGCFLIDDTIIMHDSSQVSSYLPAGAYRISSSYAIGNNTEKIYEYVELGHKSNSSSIARLGIPYGADTEPSCWATDLCYILVDVSINVGDAIVLYNDNTVDHLVFINGTSGAPAFTSLYSGLAWYWASDEAGEYTIRSNPEYPWIRGTITVS